MKTVRRSCQVTTIYDGRRLIRRLHHGLLRPARGTALHPSGPGVEGAQASDRRLQGHQGEAQYSSTPWTPLQSTASLKGARRLGPLRRAVTPGRRRAGGPVLARWLDSFTSTFVDPTESRLGTAHLARRRPFTASLSSRSLAERLLVHCVSVSVKWRSMAMWLCRVNNPPLSAKNCQRR